jgi:hypothetical protein
MKTASGGLSSHVKHILAESHDIILPDFPMLTEASSIFQIAGRQLFSSLAHEVEASLSSLHSLTTSAGLPPNSLSGAFIIRLLELAFDPSTLDRLRAPSLALIAALCRAISWVVPTFLEQSLATLALDHFLANSPMIPRDHLCYLMNVLLAADRDCYALFLSSGYLDIILASLSLQTDNPTDTGWLLIVLQQLIVSPFFDCFEAFPLITDTILKLLSDECPYLPQCLSILARILSVGSMADEHFQQAANPRIIELAVAAIDADSMPTFTGLLDYLVNYTAIGEDQTRIVIGFGFIDRFSAIFTDLAEPDQVRVLRLLANVACDSAFSDVVLGCPLLALLPEIATHGGMNLKEGALTLALKLIVHVQGSQGLKFALDLGIVGLIVDLLYSDHVGLQRNSLFALGFFFANAGAFPVEEMRALDEQLDDIVFDRLSEIMTDEEEVAAMLAQNLIRVIGDWREANPPG